MPAITLLNRINIPETMAGFLFCDVRDRTVASAVWFWIARKSLLVNFLISRQISVSFTRNVHVPEHSKILLFFGIILGSFLIRGLCYFSWYRIYRMLQKNVNFWTFDWKMNTSKKMLSTGLNLNSKNKFVFLCLNDKV